MLSYYDMKERLSSSLKNLMMVETKMKVGSPVILLGYFYSQRGKR
jgi:hypothetical protein